MARQKHIVDTLIEERAPRLASGPLWPVLAPLLRALLGYRKARAMADAVAPLSGDAALAHVSDLLKLRTTAIGLDRIPKSGRCILVANHPTGIADGVAMYDAIRRARPDFKIMANADALRVCPGLDDRIIPVVWPPETRTLKDTKDTVRRVRAALAEERAILVFAAGALAQRIDGVIQDPPWERSAVSFARKHGARITPVNIAGPCPYLFHFFDRFSTELRDVTLFHELLNKAGGNYRVIFGPSIDPACARLDDAAFTERLKDYVEQVLPGAPDTPFAWGESRTAS